MALKQKTDKIQNTKDDHDDDDDDDDDAGVLNSFFRQLINFSTHT